METFKSWEKAGEGLWAGLEEDASGRLRSGAALEPQQTPRRKRAHLGEDETATSGRRVVARRFLRYLILAIDASQASGETENLRPTRLQAVCESASEVVGDYLGSNPLCSAAVAACRDGGCELVSALSSSGRAHRSALEALRRQKPKGAFSVEAALVACSRALASTPDYGSREILVVVSALSTTDAGDVIKLGADLGRRGFRISVVSVSAETRVFRRLATEARGTFGVALDKGHLRSLLAAHVLPPPSDKPLGATTIKPPLVQMGFPSMRLEQVAPKLACFDAKEAVWTTETFACPKCQTRVKKLPIKCPACGLPLVSSAHLAASYHHLFPVPQFAEVELPRDRAEMLCFACQHPLNKPADGADVPEDKAPALAYDCPWCHELFCATCDDFIHVSLHNCPSCTSRPREDEQQATIASMEVGAA